MSSSLLNNLIKLKNSHLNKHPSKLFSDYMILIHYATPNLDMADDIVSKVDIQFNHITMWLVLYLLVTCVPRPYLHMLRSPTQP